MTDDALPLTREDKVARMAEIKAEEERLKQEYVDLRDEVTPELAEEGYTFFIDSQGRKRIAFRVAPENTVIDDDLLASYVGEDVLDEITERKVKTGLFWQAVKAGRIPENVVLKVTKLVPGTAHIRFGDPDDLAKHRGEG